MSGLLLCGKTADNPLNIKEAKLNLYSMEELCYYLYNNINMIEPDFFDDNLLRFLEEELELEKVAKKLKDQIFRKESYINMIRTILNGSYYYSDKEKEEIEEVLTKFGKMSAEERIKSRADVLVEEGRYDKALKIYQKLFTDNYKITDGRLLANIWNNMGVIYARLFLYEDAYEYFKKACDTDDEQEYKDNLICTGIFLQDEKKTVELMKNYDVSGEMINQYKKAIELAREDVKTNEDVVNEIQKFTYSSDKELTSFYKETDEILNRWKRAYREHI